MKRNGKHFVYRVDDGKNAAINISDYRPYWLPRTPRQYQWEPGEEVVYIQPTAAGYMATSIIGTLIGFVEQGNRRKAVVIWHEATEISPTISMQRLRPVSLFHGPRRFQDRSPSRRHQHGAPH